LRFTTSYHNPVPAIPCGAALSRFRSPSPIGLLPTGFHGAAVRLHGEARNRLRLRAAGRAASGIWAAWRRGVDYGALQAWSQGLLEPAPARSQPTSGPCRGGRRNIEAFPAHAVGTASKTGDRRTARETRRAAAKACIRGNGTFHGVFDLPRILPRAPLPGPPDVHGLFQASRIRFGDWVNLEAHGRGGGPRGGPSRSMVR